MYIKEAHMLIEQGLHNIGVFAYSDIHPDELDLHIHNEVWNILEEDFAPPEGSKKQALKTQANLDKYKNLIVKETEIALRTSNGLTLGNLPSDYYHLIKDRSVVLYECATCNVTSGNIVQGEWYIVKGRPITYGGIIYQKGQTFVGLVATSGFTVSPHALPTKVLLMKRKSSPNRLTEEEFIDTVNDNALTVTSKDSPLSTLAGDTIAVYTKGFFLEKLFISYFRKPKIPYLSFKQYVTGDTLSEGSTYEVISGAVVYNSLTYQARPQFQFDTFTATSNTTFTGTGIVRLRSEGDIDLPRQIAQKVVDRVVLKLSAVSEQNQQKVVNLSQLNK